jgi:hypothetical protein
MDPFNILPNMIENDWEQIDPFNDWELILILHNANTTTT